MVELWILLWFLAGGLAAFGLWYWNEDPDDWTVAQLVIVTVAGFVSAIAVALLWIGTARIPPQRKR